MHGMAFGRARETAVYNVCIAIYIRTRARAFTRSLQAKLRTRVWSNYTYTRLLPACLLLTCARLLSARERDFLGRFLPRIYFAAYARESKIGSFGAELYTKLWNFTMLWKNGAGWPFFRSLE